MAQHSVKNVTDGIRYINTTGGPIGLAPGETAEKVEVTADELKIARGTGWFEIDGKAAADADEGAADHPGIGEGPANSDTSDMVEPVPAKPKR